MSRLFIDPSIDSMGVALWKRKDWNCREHHAPTSTGLLLQHGGDWLERARDQSGNLWDWIHDEGPKESLEKVYCEMPSFFVTNRGMVAAESGSLIKLTYFVGLLAGMFQEKNVLFEVVQIQQWKGQLPKEVVKKRILKVLGSSACSEFRLDVWDAVGMGLWKKGIL